MLFHVGLIFRLDVRGAWWGCVGDLLGFSCRFVRFFDHIECLVNVLEATNVFGCCGGLLFLSLLLFLYDSVNLIKVKLQGVRWVFKDLAGLFVMDAKVYLLIILFGKLLDLLDKALSFVVESVVPFECFSLLQLGCLRYNLYTWLLQHWWVILWFNFQFKIQLYNSAIRELIKRIGAWIKESYISNQKSNHIHKPDLLKIKLSDLF